MISIIHITIEELYSLQKNIPEFKNYYKPEEIKVRLSQGAIILKAVEHHQVQGFKVGYPLSPFVFYSWLGGVFPNYRRRGVAKKLLDHQEKMAKEKGFRIIRVKSMNCFKNMMIFLIKNDYLVSGYEDKGDMLENKIIFEKNILC